MNVSFINLKRQYEEIKSEIDGAIEEVVSKQQFVGGDILKNFETKWLDFLGAKHGCGCSTGTNALEIALRALQIGEGDKVLVPAMTFIATAEAVSNVGATPIFLDVNPDDYTIDVRNITVDSTYKAIIPVHLYGTPCNMDEIMTFAKANNLKVIEDTAQAHNAEFNGKKLGTIGDAGAFSFYPSKNLGAYGDGGFIVFNNSETSLFAKQYIDHGRPDKFTHTFRP